MSKSIETIALAQVISARMETKDSSGNVISVDNEGQMCMALVPAWANWGSTLLDGSKLETGKYYKITIEVDN